MANFSPLLPKTNKPFPGGPTAGGWHMQAGVGLFNQLATAIDCSNANCEINSIPSPWSRLLQLLAAVRNPNYPTRLQLISQYRGLLALLALSENLCLDITATRITLSEHKNSPFAKSLVRLKPLADDNITTISSDPNSDDPWDTIYVFSLEGHSIGITSAATIISPASFLSTEIESLVPWISNGKFEDPIRHLNPSQCTILAGWLQRLGNELLSVNSLPGGNPSLASSVARELNLFAADLVGNYLQINQPRASSKKIPFQVELSPALLRNLYPAGAESEPSNVRVIPSQQREADPLEAPGSLFLIDPDEMPVRIGTTAQNIFVVGPLTLANITLQKAREIDNRSLYWRPEDFFLNELFYLEEKDAMPGSWVAYKLAEAQIDDLTIILPINPLLRNYISCDDLEKRIDIEKLAMNDGDGLRITLTLPLSGFNGEKIDYSIHRSFPLNSRNKLEGRVPSMAIWPHIPVSTGWKKYFTLIESSSLDPLAFSIEEAPTYDSVISGDSAQRGSPLSATDSSSFLYYKSKTLPQYLIASRQGSQIGIIPIRIPAVPTITTSNWTVGVDFGTSLTNIAVRKGVGNAAPVKLRFNTLLLSIGSLEAGAAKQVLREYFIPDNQSLFEAGVQVATGQNRSDSEFSIPPLFTILTTRGSQLSRGQTPFMIEQGRIYFTLSKVDFSQQHYHSNIKWSDDESALQETFLEQIICSVSAQAAYEGVRQIEWRASFPTAFNKGQIAAYKGTWETLILKARREYSTNLQHQCQSSATHDTESVVFAQYCAAIEGRQLDNTACIDIGGGTSDLSIWKNRKLVHQCSVQYAGRDIFHHILRPSPGKSNVSKFGNILGLNQNPILDLDSNFDASIDVYLRYNSENLFGPAGSYRKVSNSSQQPINKYFRTLMAFSFGSIYYYLGIVLRSLIKEGVFDASLGINPSVLLGGNGSRFLRWIHPAIPDFKQSPAHTLLNQILSSASELSANPKGSECTSSPKSEACLGLAIDPGTTRLEVAVNTRDDQPYSGLLATLKCLDEDGERTIICNSEERFNVPAEAIISNYTINGYAEIDAYIAAFNQAVKALDSDEFFPLQFWSGERIRSLSANRQLSLLTKQIVADTCTLMVRRSKPEPQLGFTSKLFEPEPPFITVMKCLTRALAEKWAEDA